MMGPKFEVNQRVIFNKKDHRANGCKLIVTEVLVKGFSFSNRGIAKKLVLKDLNSPRQFGDSYFYKLRSGSIPWQEVPESELIAVPNSLKFICDE